MVIKIITLIIIKTIMKMHIISEAEKNNDINDS